MHEKTLEQLKTPGAEVAVDGEAWERSPLAIAGATHLPKREQLKWWAEYHGIECTYEPSIDRYRLRRGFGSGRDSQNDALCNGGTPP